MSHSAATNPTIASIVVANCRCSSSYEALSLAMQPHNSTPPKTSSRLIPIVLCVAALGLLAAIAIPNYVRARTTMSMNSCIFNQMWIESAKRRWAAENHKPAEAVPTDADLLTYMRKVKPMWAGREITMDVPAQLPSCFLVPTDYAVGSVTNPTHCNAPSDHWDEADYRFHYALDPR